jgi:threonine 3-dehydrogenase
VARLLRQTRRHEPIKVLFPSTIASFGEHLSPPFDHNNVANEATQMPTTIYGVAKVSVERLGEYYYRQRRGTLDGLPWVDFRGVRFPSVLGASRGPGGTTAYSTLMIEEPVLGNNYEAYVAEDVRLAILYVKDAVQALRKLEAAPDDQLGSSGAPPGSTPQNRPIRRVFNIRGIIDPATNQPPTARQIADALAQLGGQAAQANPEKFPRGIGNITFKSDPALQKTVTSFGILDESCANQEIGYEGQFTKLNDAIQDFIQEVVDSPGRLTRLDLIG